MPKDTYDLSNILKYCSTCACDRQDIIVNATSATTM